MKLVRNLSFLVLPIAMLACSASETTNPTPPGAPGTAAGGDAGTGKPGTPGKPGSKPTSKPQTKVATKSLGTKYKGSTPPSGAKTLGKKSSPKAGSTVVPIVDAEVYVFTLDLDEDGKEDTISWAHVDGRTYLWSEGPMVCNDGLSDGSAAFVAEINEDGTGSYLFSVDECPQNDLFGCEFDADGNDTTCGACAWSGPVIACVVATE